MQAHFTNEMLRKLDLNNFEIGDRVIHCPSCFWQVHEKDIAMKPVCPDCRHALQLTNVDQELLKAIVDADTEYELEVNLDTWLAKLRTLVLKYGGFGGGVYGSLSRSQTPVFKLGGSTVDHFDTGPDVMILAAAPNLEELLGSDSFLGLLELK